MDHFEQSIEFMTSTLGTLLLYGSILLPVTPLVLSITSIGSLLRWSEFSLIDRIAVNARNAMDFISVYIENLSINDNASVSFSAAKMQNVSINAGATVDFKSVRMKYLAINDNTSVIRFLSSARIKYLSMNGGTVELLDEIHRSMIYALKGRNEEFDQDVTNEGLQMVIENLSIRGGSFRAATKLDVRYFDISDGKLIFENGNRPLHFAVRKGKNFIVRLLLEKGANPHTTNGVVEQIIRRSRIFLQGSEWTPLHVAAHHGYEAIIGILLENGVDIFTEDEIGNTALQIATSQHHCGAVALLENARTGSLNNLWKRISHILCVLNGQIGRMG